MDLGLTLFQTLVASAAMLGVALAVLLIYIRASGAKPNQPAGDKNEPYVGGEQQPFDEESIGSGNLFWSIINQSLKTLYRRIVDRFNTYEIDAWLVYMSAWLAFLIILLIIVVVVL
jgi:hypothetical protein